MKKFLIMLLPCVCGAAAGMAQDIPRPRWAENPPASDGYAFYFEFGEAIGKTDAEAISSAFDDAFRNAQFSGGNLVIDQQALSDIKSGLKGQTLATNGIAVRRFCVKTTPHDGKVKAYVLVQVQKNANTPPNFGAANTSICDDPDFDRRVKDKNKVTQYFVLYNASPGAWGGLRLGMCRYFGGYFQLRGGTIGVFKDEINLSMNLPAQRIETPKPMEKLAYRRSITLGGMLRLGTNHLHLYAGAGYGMQADVDKYENRSYQLSERYGDTYYIGDCFDKPSVGNHAYYTPAINSGLECEAGLVFNLGTEYGAFSLSLGYSMLNPAADMYGEIQFGIGFYFGL